MGDHVHTITSLIDVDDVNGNEVLGTTEAGTIGQANAWYELDFPETVSPNIAQEMKFQCIAAILARKAELACDDHGVMRVS